MARDVANENLQYTGERQPSLGERDDNGLPLLPYLPSPGLIEVVNMAIYLERPLLLKGEPGSGKRRDWPAPSPTSSGCRTRLGTSSRPAGRAMACTPTTPSDGCGTRSSAA
jgi:hypothetical protein